MKKQHDMAAATQHLPARFTATLGLGPIFVVQVAAVVMQVMVKAIHSLRLQGWTD